MTSRPARLLAPAALALAVLAGLSSSAIADPAVGNRTVVKPGTLERGANPAIAQLLGTTILDGDVRIEIQAQEVQLYGMSDDDYVVGIWRRNGRSAVLRVAADGSREKVRDRVKDPVLSSGRSSSSSRRSSSPTPPRSSPSATHTPVTG